MTISTEAVILTGADDSIKKKETFAEAVKAVLGGEAYAISLNPDKEKIAHLVEVAKDKDLIIIGSYNASLNKGQAQLINELLKVNENIVVAALRNPYDIDSFMDIPCYMCAYEYTKLSIESVIKVLSGQLKPEGKLPVKL
jgi:beta-N-acetylhexosaminidase